MSLRLTEADYAKLEREAARLGLRPAVLARLMLRVSLNSPAAMHQRYTRRDAAAALHDLEDDATAGRTVEFDAVELIRRLREDRAADLVGVPLPERGSA